MQAIRRVASGGNLEIVSNPYRTTADSTMGWTCTQYDSDGRVRYVGSFSGATAPESCLDTSGRTGLSQTSYQGEVTVALDPANKGRNLTHDALGRLVEVVEDPGGLNYTTTYYYNALDNLTDVLQGAQPRTFVYSSLGRLRSGANPESGTTSYAYLDHGGLHTKTGARTITTTFGYDALHRLQTKSYSDGTPAVTQAYYLAGNSPKVGRLQSVTTPDRSTTYAYDALGRVTGSTQTVTGISSYSFQYTWLLNDGPESMQYPSGRSVAYTQDDAGRVTAVGSYASGIQYAPHGALAQLQLGNGLWESTQYNSRLQPSAIKLGTSAGSDGVFGSALGYETSGDNNGNVLNQTITGSGLSATQTYQYDGVNRISSASESGGAWSRNFGYDAKSNGWVSSWTGISPASFTPQSSSWFNSNNQLMNAGLGIQHDAAGNQTAIGGYSFTFDAENRLKTSTQSGDTTNVYDGEGRRVKKVNPDQSQTVYVYNAMGQLAAEYASNPPAGGGTTYLTADHLGSTRVATSATGTTLARRDYLPFGEEIPSSIGNRTSLWSADMGATQKFTGKERDAETGLDYFNVRYMASAQGRFTSPDPLVWQSWQSGTEDEQARFREFISNPQNFNLYTYGLNNPLKYNDPTGLDVELALNFVGYVSDEEKRRILAAVRGYLENLNVGKVVVRDASDGSQDKRTSWQKVKDLFAVDYHSITVDLAHPNQFGNNADRPNFVKAFNMARTGDPGDYFGDLRRSDPTQWSNIIAWRVLHESVSHAFGIGPDNDQLVRVGGPRAGTLIQGSHGRGKPGIPPLNPADTSAIQRLLVPRTRSYGQ